jgi:hypothetical protein
VHAPAYLPADYEENYFGPLDVKLAIRIMDSNEGAKARPHKEAAKAHK